MLSLAIFALSAASPASNGACDRGINGTQITAVPCDDSRVAAVLEWASLPAVSYPPTTVQLKNDPSLCLDFLCDQSPCFSAGHYGPDAFLLACGAHTPTLAAHPDGTITIHGGGTAGGIDGYCLDLRGASDVQAYPCVGSANQKWAANATTGQLVSSGGVGAGSCVVGCEHDYEYCPKLHPVTDAGVYDPSGPLHDDKNGVWHVWEDEGAWSHWMTTDLVRWSGGFSKSTNFGGDTGSVSPTPSGTYAFFPIMPASVQIGSAKASDAGFTQWEMRGPTIDMPKGIDAGFRDPVRAFEHAGKWWVGVGCGSKEVGAQFCLFEAADDTLANFTHRGALYVTNTTFGRVDSDEVWQPQNVSANMMECPDLFPLGDKWVLLGSLYQTNQWWVGSLSGDPPRFTPERVGILDYGNGYAAKSGSSLVQSGQTRRLLFGFTGWSEPTAAPSCGRSLTIPREVTVLGNALGIRPIAEIARLRTPGSYRATTLGNAAGGHAPLIASGSQVELQLSCTGVAAALKARAHGRVGLRTLQTPDASQYLELGYDFSNQTFYANHSKCCTRPNLIVQRAPLLATDLADDTLELHAVVDGGLVEAFAGGRVVMTPLIAPDPGVRAANRMTSAFSEVPQLSCTAKSWQLAY